MVVPTRPWAPVLPCCVCSWRAPTPPTRPPGGGGAGGGRGAGAAGGPSDVGVLVDFGGAEGETAVGGRGDVRVRREEGLEGALVVQGG